MKRKSIVTWLVLALAVSALLLASCGKAKTSTGSPESTTSKPPAGSATTAGSAATKTTAATTTSKAPTGSSGSSVASLLGKFTANSSVKYDSVTTGPGVPATTQSIWLKGTKMRIEMTVQGAKSVILIDQGARVMYNYMPDQNMAFKMDINQAPGSASQDTTKVLDYNPAIVGTETFDGKLCTIIQFTNQAVTTKQWIWQDRGFPVKIEATSSVGVTTTENKNISFEDIPDSTFQLPAGVEISEFSLPTGLPTGLPTNLPTGLPTTP